MLLHQCAKSYRKVAFSTSEPGRLVLMLFDGALRHLAAANAGFEQSDLVRRYGLVHQHLTQATEILRELQGSLDLKVEGDFAPRMFALYGFMISSLERANLKKDPEPISAVNDMLSQIRGAWAQMLDQPSANVA